MSQSFLYRIHPDNKVLQGIREVDFCDANFKERYDIQEWVESTPSILGEELLIIAKESSCFEGTRERPDLIALDKSGNVVVIELKRDDSGVNLEWQAIKYASYWSRFKPNEIAKVYSDYLRKTVKTEDDLEDYESKAEADIVDFIDEDSISEINKKQRLILVSHRYAREVTSAVHWLIDNYNVDIKCIQLIPFHDVDKDSYYLQSNIILPVPGIDELLVRAATSGSIVQSRSVGTVRKDDLVTAFFEKLRDALRVDVRLQDKPTKYSRWAGTSGQIRYYHFWYDNSPWDNKGMSYMIDLYSNESRDDLKNKFCVHLGISKEHLLNKGVSELALSGLFDTLCKYNNIYKVYKAGRDMIYAEKSLDMIEMDEKEMLKVKDVLIELINNTKPAIDEICCI